MTWLPLLIIAGCLMFAARRRAMSIDELPDWMPLKKEVTA